MPKTQTYTHLMAGRHLLTAVVVFLTIVLWAPVLRAQTLLSHTLARYRTLVG